MGRPKKVRIVSSEPKVKYFKPRAVPLNNLVEVEITVDEMETMRLSDIEKLSQKDGAERMGIHQSTFQRTLANAREKIADAIVNGKAIKIIGGAYDMPGGDGSGPRGMGAGSGRGLGRDSGGGAGRMGGPLAAGPDGKCKCPKCGYEMAHIRGSPCNQTKCPKCGAIMARS